MEHDEIGCQAPPEGPILCINNCGFFGSAGTMNMCSKCHKDFILQQEQDKMAATSFDNIVNGTSSSDKEPAISAATVDVRVDSVEPKAAIALPPPAVSGSSGGSSGDELLKAAKATGPSRCTSCNKRVGLTGFKCRCGHLFCGSHRYSDKHNCQFDYRSAAQDAIAVANPVIKAEKLDKI